MRETVSLNQGWTFFGPGGRKEKVNVPHTWNGADGQDGGDDYARCVCRYEKEFQAPKHEDGQRVYLRFYGVNASCSATLNGRQVVSHDGGYSLFCADVTEALGEENHLTVTVDNEKNGRVYPQKADFTFYGGIYRDVELLVVNRDHFDLDYFGGSGLQITPTVEGKDGRVRVQTYCKAEGCIVSVSVLDAQGVETARAEGSDVTLLIPGVRLWDGTADPYLYVAVARLMRDGEVLDEVRSTFGVRSFFVDPKKGFFLNGRSYPLRGVSRHQDRPGLGNAITRAEHEEDIALIREVGANTVRLAHYQHDPYFYDLCDRYGLIVWAEIPYISEHMPDGRDNTVTQMKELIVQNYNHPSIVMWGLSNEITISTKDTKDMLDNHRLLYDLCHRMDDSRPTTLACYAMCSPFHKVAHISDLVAWNLYLGWYVPGLWLNDAWMWLFHTCYPKRPLGYSEYGCEAMPNLHSDRPRRGDHTEEYQCVYHEYMLRCFKRHPYLWATYVWNMFDFAADARDQGGEPGRNHKGLVTFDRKIKKDSFYLYKAWWSSEPFVHLCGKRYVDRTGKKIKVKVYSNQPRVALYADGTLIAEQEGEKVFVFTVSLTGERRLEVRAGDCSDTLFVRRVDVPNPSYRLKKNAGNGQNWV